MVTARAMHVVRSGCVCSSLLDHTLLPPRKRYEKRYDYLTVRLPQMRQHSFGRPNQIGMACL